MGFPFLSGDTGRKPMTEHFSCFLSDRGPFSLFRLNICMFGR